MKPTTWKEALNHWLPRLGHRNWIAVVDSAYPLQSGDGFEMIITNEPHWSVAQAVKDAIDAAVHVRSTPLVDEELIFMDSVPIPNWINPDNCHPHESLISRLNSAATNFKIVIIKTEETTAYSSIFFPLECGYWSDAQELELRNKMERKSS